MKSSIIPCHILGAATILGIWLITTNRNKMDKLVKNVSDSMNQMYQSCKKTIQKDSCSCGQNENGQC